MGTTNLDNLVLSQGLASASIDPKIRQRAVKQLTNAQMLALRATPITLVADPGANYVVIVEDVYMVSHTVTAAYTESADNLDILYAGSTTIMTVETTGFIDQVGDQIRHMLPATTATITPVKNKAVQIHNGGDGEFGGGNAADTLSVEVIYRVEPATAFSS